MKGIKENRHIDMNLLRDGIILKDRFIKYRIANIPTATSIA